MSPYELHVLAIGPYGSLSVCSVGDLYDRLNDEESMDDAIMNAGIESFTNLREEDVRRVRQLNETGDAGAFWS